MSSSDGHDEAEAAADERDMPAASGNNELIQGVAAVLREASAALARLGANPSPSGQQQPGGGIPNANLAGAAAALAQAASAIAFKKGGAVLPDPLRISDPLRLEEAPQMTVSEFVDSNSLDEWVGLALSTLTPTQRAAVVNPPLKVENTRNISGVVMSRIKQVAPVEQRIQMFVKVNDLGDGVVDRLSTLTTDECEAVMDSGMKIQKATNPSGVAMKRITDVLKKTRNGRGVQLVSRHEKPTWSKGREIGSYNTERRGHESESRHQSGHDDGGGRSYLPRDVQELMRDLGLEWWCGEVLRRLSLWQRQKVIREIGPLHGVRNPSGVVMSRIKTVASPEEILAIFVDINGLDRDCEAKLWGLTPEQRAAVIAPGIYMQNVRNVTTAVLSRIQNVLAGKSAMQRGALRGGDHADDDRSCAGSHEDTGGARYAGRHDRTAFHNDRRRPASAESRAPPWRSGPGRSSPPARASPRAPRRSARGGGGSRSRHRRSRADPSSDDDENSDGSDSTPPPSSKRRRRHWR